MQPRALIAEDEPLLAAELRSALAAAWPGLEIVAVVGDGESALERTLALRPDVCFLDIRMPEMSGLEVAQALAEDWRDDAGAFPLVVFVSAYDRYALQAFEHAAFDYVLKPVDAPRLARTCARLRDAIAARSGAAASVAGAVEQLRALLAGAPAAPKAEAPLRVIQAGVGNTIHMVPIDDVVYFEAADKYVRVVTVDREHLVRVSLRELLPQLDPARFWQVHRGAVVRVDAIATAERDDTGRVTLALRGRAERLTVSRLYAPLFKSM
ncbi:MAG TPA: LytTR family DNA-binding domain-containing protein [Caldimonas sp.]